MTTKRQGDLVRKNILNVIINYIDKHVYPPTCREICILTGIRSTASVHRYLQQMLKQGMIETDAGLGQSRAIRIPHYKFVKK